MFGKKKFELAARHRVQKRKSGLRRHPHAARRNALLFTPSGFDNYYAQIDHKFTTRSGFAIFFREKASSILSKGDKTHMFKAFTYLKRAHSVAYLHNKTQNNQPFLKFSSKQVTAPELDKTPSTSGLSPFGPWVAETLLPRLAQPIR